jgi:hypothetical protein
MPTLSYTTDGITASVSFDRWDSLQHDRARWNYRFAAVDDSFSCVGDDLTTVGDPSYTEALRALLSFLEAWCESSEDGENSSLFDLPDLYKAPLQDWVQLAAADFQTQEA